VCPEAYQIHPKSAEYKVAFIFFLYVLLVNAAVDVSEQRIFFGFAADA
jgi:hypothetical protein